MVMATFTTYQAYMYKVYVDVLLFTLNLTFFIIHCYAIIIRHSLLRNFRRISARNIKLIDLVAFGMSQVKTRIMSLKSVAKL